MIINNNERINLTFRVNGGYFFVLKFKLLVGIVKNKLGRNWVGNQLSGNSIGKYSQRMSQSYKNNVYA